uniref:Protein AAR2 homolog n=1 Tax=Oncorhynchus tshawytscha TaxID=74940 RepID=A0AAZ3SDW5_ONCTS
MKHGLMINPEVAWGLFEEGGTELGINYKSWQVGSCFQGVKMIPPGLHFLHYCSSNLIYKCVSLTAWVNQELATRLQLLLGCMCAIKSHFITNLCRNLRFISKGLTYFFLPLYALDILLEKHHQQQPLNELAGEASAGPDLYLGLIAVLYQQLGEIPTDFSVDIVSQDNYLTSTLQDFFQFASGPGVDGTLQKGAEKFKAHLTTEVDPDDCDPVVVLLPERITLD